jgi:acid phosphatase type 7
VGRTRLAAAVGHAQPAPVIALRSTPSRPRSRLAPRAVLVSLLVATATSGAALLAACSDDNEAKPPASGQGGSAAGSGSAGTGGSEAGSGGGVSDSFCGTDGVSKGPWVVDATSTTARVRWESCVAGSNRVSVAPEAGGPAKEVTATTSTYEVKNEYKAIPMNIPHDLPGTWIMHEATLTGLTPSTCYAYTVADTTTERGRFCTARASGEAMTIFAIGDTNPGLNDSTERVLDSVLPANPDFILHQGDMQYYDSYLETYASWFPLMERLLRQGAILPAVGNHESEKPDEFEAYYQRFFGGAGEGAGTGKTYYRYSNGGLAFFSLDTEQSLKPGSEQATWLLAGLEAAQKEPGFRGSIVWMHRPFATCGDSARLLEEREALAPSFETFGVRLVLCGHVHGYERFQFGTIPYVVTGGGGGLKGDPDENIDRPECAQRLVRDGEYHGLILRVENGEIAGTAINLKGKTIDTFTVGLVSPK